MKNILTTLLLILVTLIVHSQQAPMQTVSEHYTNTKCSICNTKNPGFNNNLNNYPNVFRISIHPSSPYASCILSQQNKVDNDARTNYYGVFGGTPRIMMNGELVSTSANYADSNIIKPFLNKTSSFTITTKIVKVGLDSIRTIITIKKVDTSSLTNAILFLGFAEDTVFVNGGNGELKHYNVLRKALQQNVVLPVQKNDSIVIGSTTKIQSIWNLYRMFGFGILNHGTNKKVIQSGYGAKYADAVAGPSTQVPLKVVAEHFTNTKCGVCSSRNPGFDNNLSVFPNVFRLSIHPSAPYSSCILSQQNKVDNDARTNYYSVYGGTPRIVFNGEVVSSSVNYSDSNIIKPYLNKYTSFTLTTKILKIGMDSARTVVVIKKVDTSSLSNATLFMGFAEDTVFVNGGNGELKHYNVLRKAIQQNVVLPTAIGDSIEMIGTTAIQTIWNLNRMFGFGILNQVSDKKVIQSGISSLIVNKTSVPSSIDALTNSKMIRVSPNPTSDFLSIQSDDADELQYDLLNDNGSVLLSGKFHESSKIDLIHLNRGIYFLRLSNSNVKEIRKIVIER